MSDLRMTCEDCGTSMPHVLLTYVHTHQACERTGEPCGRENECASEVVCGDRWACRARRHLTTWRGRR